MPFKTNYRLQRADRRRAKEEQQQKKLLKRAERDAGEKANDSSAPGDDAADGEHGATEADSVT